MLASGSADSAIDYCRLNKFDHRLRKYFYNLINWHYEALLVILSKGEYERQTKDIRTRTRNQRANQVSEQTTSRAIEQSIIP
jgi:hypothetical protein